MLFFTQTWLACATSSRCTLPTNGPASLSPPMLAMHARARHCPASSIASKSVLMAVMTVATRSSGASAGCTMSATAAYPTTFSLYLVDIIRLMASMWPKSTSYPKTKMYTSFHMYFFLWYLKSTIGCSVREGNRGALWNGTRAAHELSPFSDENLDRMLASSFSTRRACGNARGRSSSKKRRSGHPTLPNGAWTTIY